MVHPLNFTQVDSLGFASFFLLLQITLSLKQCGNFEGSRCSFPAASVYIVVLTIVLLLIQFPSHEETLPLHSSTATSSHYFSHLLMLHCHYPLNQIHNQSHQSWNYWNC